MGKKERRLPIKYYNVCITVITAEHWVVGILE